MREMTIINGNDQSKNHDTTIDHNLETTRYCIESKTFGPFGPVAKFDLMIYQQNDTRILMSLDEWRASPLFQSYLRFTEFDPQNIGQHLDIAFALKALLKHPYADYKLKAFKHILDGTACQHNRMARQVVLRKDALKALVSAIRPAVEYTYLKGEQEQQEFWRHIFDQKGARYSDGMINGTFGCGENLVKPCINHLKSALPKIERMFYSAG